MQCSVMTFTTFTLTCSIELRIIATVDAENVGLSQEN